MMKYHTRGLAARTHFIRGVRPLGAHGRGSPGRRHLPFCRKLRAHSSVDPRKLYGRRAAGGGGGSSAPERSIPAPPAAPAGYDRLYFFARPPRVL